MEVTVFEVWIVSKHIKAKAMCYSWQLSDYFREIFGPSQLLNLVLIPCISIISQLSSGIWKSAKLLWKKSCTNWHCKYPNIYKVLYIPGGAGFLPSTVLLNKCPFPIVRSTFKMAMDLVAMFFDWIWRIDCAVQSHGAHLPGCPAGTLVNGLQPLSSWWFQPIWKILQ